MFTTLVVTSVFVFAGKAADAACPSGWLAHAQSCYHLSHDKEIWVGARLICKSFNADLVVIESQDEDTFLKTQVDEYAHKFNVSPLFWCGANDLEEERHWVWAPLGFPINDYTNWASGEPSNTNLGQNCMEIRSSGSGWYDKECSHEYRYICEMTGL